MGKRFALGVGIRLGIGWGRLEPGRGHMLTPTLKPIRTQAAFYMGPSWAPVGP